MARLGLGTRIPGCVYPYVFVCVSVRDSVTITFAWGVNNVIRQAWLPYRTGQVHPVGFNPPSVALLPFCAYEDVETSVSSFASILCSH